MNKIITIVACFFFSGFHVHSQPISIDETSSSHMLSPIGATFNRIFNSRDLDSFYNKLAALKKNKKGVIRIVHIGDSHIQSGYFPGYVRNNLQQYFGNAGRGLVFPYGVAQTTSPPDINSSSNTGWNLGKVIGPGANLAGVSGFSLQTHATGATIDLGLQAEELGNPVFTRLKFFINNPSSWLLRAANNATSYFVKNNEVNKTQYTEILLENPANSFVLSSLPSITPQSFFGVSLENEQPGILYHAIGVNGARFEQYNTATLFWQQLPGLQADLYIVSLGTNEAQRNSFEAASFRKQVSVFLQKLKATAPRAAILITTAADSYKGGRPNAQLRLLNLSLFEYCTEHNIPVWDLYRVTNGYGSAFNWLSRGMMNTDLVHFNSDGYRLQGQLLFNAMAKGYNSYNGY